MEENKLCACEADEMCEICANKKYEQYEASERGFNSVLEMKKYDLKIESKINQIKFILNGMSISEIEIICSSVPELIKSETNYKSKINNN